MTAARPEDQQATGERTGPELADTLPLMIWQSAADGSVLWFNQRFHDYAGAATNDGLGWNWTGLVRPRERADVEAQWREAIRLGAARRVDARLRRHDGAWRWFSISAQPQRDAAGKVTGWLGSAVDVDDIKRSQTSSHAKTQLLEALTRDSQNMIGAVDRSHRLLFANPRSQSAIEALYGKEVVVGAALESFVDAADLPVVQAALDRIIRGEPAAVIEKLGGPRQQRVFEIRLHPIFEDEDISGVGFSAIDITAQSSADELEWFLSDLEASLRQLADADEIRRTAVTLLGRHLSVNRCVYGEIEIDGEHFFLGGNYVDDVADASGYYCFADFGPQARHNLRAGEPLIVCDSQADPELGDGDRQNFAALEMAAVLAVPLQRDGRTVAFLAVHSRHTRQWRADEVTLLGAVANRCWESIERARAETAARIRDERLRTLVVGTSQMVWSASPQGQVMEDSPSCRAFTGQSREQWLQSGWLDALHPEDRRWVGGAWQNAIARRKPIESEYRLRHFSGEWRWTSVRVHPLFNADGSLREWVGMNTDISARKRAELRDALLVRIYDQLRPLTDPDEIALTASRLLCDHLAADRASYFEVEEDQVHCTRMLDYAPCGASTPERYSLDDYGFAIGESLRSNRDFVCNDITHAGLTEAERANYIRQEVGALIDLPLHKNNRLVAFVGLYQRDPRHWQPDEIELAHLVAGRCWESIERARVTRELVQADRHKDEFLATLAHELRNPLAPLRNALDIIRHAPADFRLAPVHEMMGRQVDQLVRLVDDLLDVSRITSGKIALQMETLALSDVLSTAVETARPLIESGRHQLQLDLGKEPVRVHGDALRIAQIVTNLLNNAAKFTDAGGRIQMSLRREDAQAVIRVRDNGVGIAPPMRERVFDLFTQISRGPRQTHGGLGIGLSLARSLTRLHNGSIEVHSEGVGRGSEFVLRLPAIADAAVDTAPAGDAPAALAAVASRILVVDDNRDAADTIAMLLELLGADVETVYRAADAIAALDRYQPAIAFLDIGMPDMDGHQLARVIREHPRGRGVRLVALTGWGQDSDRLRSKQAGFEHHLVKPIDLQALEAVLALLSADGSQTS